MSGDLIISLLVLVTSLSAGSSDGMPRRPLIPEGQLLKAQHHLSKRQATSCTVFFRNEPASFYYCATPNITLGCHVQLGNIPSGGNLDILWFYSQSGFVAGQIQVSQFPARRFTRVESTLVVSEGNGEIL